MAHNSLAKVATDVYVNFYEVASIEPDTDGDETQVLIVLKCGHKIAIADTTVSDVAKAIQRTVNGDTSMGRHVGLRDTDHGQWED